MKISKLLKIISALIAISVVIFLGAIASVAYTLIQSAPTMKVGSPSQNLTGGALEFLIPVSLDNRGVLPISELFMTGSVKTHYGTTLLDLKSSKLTLPPGGSGTLEVRLTVDLSKATPELMRVLLTEDQDLQVNVMFNGAVQPFLSVLVKANDTMKWGAPYKDLQIKEPTLSSHNATHLFIQVPISFKNNSTIFSVEGVSSIMVIDEEYRLVGYGWTHMDVKPKGEYSGTIDLYLESPWIGHPELLTQSLSKNYTVTISMPAPIVGEFKQTQTVSMEWGAPISDPQLGGFSASPHNSTHFRISVPLTFKDASPLPLTGKLSGAFYDAAGNRVGDVDQLWVEVQPGQTYVGTITGYVSNAAASQQSLNLLIVLDSPYGVYEKGLV
ncbi:MAG: hypothetical protein QXN69_05345, partial [Candidatus Methanomethylicaceae archaeon]